MNCGWLLEKSESGTVVVRLERRLRKPPISQRFLGVHLSDSRQQL